MPFVRETAFGPGEQLAAVRHRDESGHRMCDTRPLAQCRTSPQRAYDGNTRSCRQSEHGGRREVIAKATDVLLKAFAAAHAWPSGIEKQPVIQFCFIVNELGSHGVCRVSLTDCECRYEIEGTQVWLCAHPKVYMRDHVTTSAVCRTCRYAGDFVPLELQRSLYFHGDPFLNLGRVSVVIPCHNYGDYLAECIESVLNQSVPVHEIIVVLDRCRDHSAKVADQFVDSGVRVVPVEFGNVHETRRRGFEESTGDVVCFLDADDRLDTEYLERGLKLFDSDDVAIVYSDLSLFGSRTGTRDFPEEFAREPFFRQNFIHAGSLVRRDALELSTAFQADLDARTASCTGDWWLWRCLIKEGWTARKQDGTYHYRQHPVSALKTQAKKLSYYELSWLDRERVTLCLPLSGRRTLWSKTRRFLEEQTWPRNQIHLLVIDTSQDSGWSHEVQEWLANSDYDDYRYLTRSVGVRGLADADRLTAATDVRKAMARIYNFLRAELTTDFVWILEDDILPPPDVARQLLMQFDETTASVAAPYRSRFHSGFVVWDERQNSIQNAPDGVTTVGGNGFGCAMVRAEVFSNTAFSHAVRMPDFDKAVYRSIGLTGLKSKVNWEVECRHLEMAEEN